MISLRCTESQKNCFIQLYSNQSRSELKQRMWTVNVNDIDIYTRNYFTVTFHIFLLLTRCQHEKMFKFKKHQE
jgi:hypothetical protein